MKSRNKRPFTSRYTKFENNIEGFDAEGYREMVEEGLEDKEIARELNINEKFLEGMKKDIYEEY